MSKRGESLYVALMRIGFEITQRGEPITSNKIYDELKAQKVEAAFTPGSWRKHKADAGNFPKKRLGVDNLISYLFFEGGVRADSRNETEGKWPPIETYLGYLEYIELQDARKSAKEARWYAIAAIVISSVLALASICISIHQINTTATIRISEDQLDNLLKMHGKSEELRAMLKTPPAPPPPSSPPPPDRR